jgi:hypothetical protein
MYRRNCAGEEQHGCLDEVAHGIMEGRQLESFLICFLSLAHYCRMACSSISINTLVFSLVDQ